MFIRLFLRFCIALLVGWLSRPPSPRETAGETAGETAPARDQRRNARRGGFRRGNARPAFLLSMAMLAALGGWANATSENSELKRQANNEAKLAQLHPWIRPKIAATLRDVEGHGGRPRLDKVTGVKKPSEPWKPYVVQSWRSLSDQQKAKAAGNSKVSWSFHNATSPKGKKEALAIDVVDHRYFWQTGDEFFLLLASAAQSHELETGIRWGTKPDERARIDALIATKNWEGKYKRGWDAGHVQPSSKILTISQAKAGKRPQSKTPRDSFRARDAPVATQANAKSKR